MRYLYISEVASNITISYKGVLMTTKTASRTPGQWISHLKSKGAPAKLIDQIKAIEQSGKDYGRSKEYIMRTIIDKIPKKYIEEPTAAHGPEKSGPKSDSKAYIKSESRRKSMELKLENRKAELNQKDHKAIEDIIIKLASANNIDNVERVYISLNKDMGFIRFKKSYGGVLDSDYGPIGYVFNHDETDILDDIQEFFQLPDGAAKLIWQSVKPAADAVVSKLKAGGGGAAQTDSSNLGGGGFVGGGNYGDLVTNFSEYYDINAQQATYLLETILPQMKTAVGQVLSQEGEAGRMVSSVL